MLRFDQAEGQIVVANVESMALHDSRDTVQAAPPRKQNRKDVSIATIVVEKASRDVRAYDKDGKLLGFIPPRLAATKSRRRQAPSKCCASQGALHHPLDLAQHPERVEAIGTAAVEAKDLTRPFR